MKSVNYALRNINILNLLLLAVSAGLFFTLVYPLLDVDVKVNIPQIKEALVKKEENAVAASIPNILDYFILTEDHFFHPFTIFAPRTNISQSKTGSAKKEEKIAAENIATTLDYVIVTEKNLFHPERKMPLEKNEEQQIVRPEIIFYGAIITDEKRIAYIEDKKNPYSTPGRGKRQTPIVQGAMIGGYKLMEVNPETIVLVRGNDKMVVNLRDQKDRKQDETTVKSQAPSVKAYGPSSIQQPSTSTGPSMSPPSTTAGPPIVPQPGRRGASMPSPLPAKPIVDR